MLKNKNIESFAKKVEHSDSDDFNYLLLYHKIEISTLSLQEMTQDENCYELYECEASTGWNMPVPVVDLVLLMWEL